MITRAEKTILYVCPYCNRTVQSYADIFTLSEKEFPIWCECGKTHVGLRRNGGRIQIFWPCLFCGETHVKYVTIKAFSNSKPILYSCTTHGLPCFFLGTKEQAESAAAEIMEAVDAILDSMDFDDYILNKEVFFETLEILDKYAEEQKISCVCGKLSLKTKLNYDNIELCCMSCGARAILATAEERDIATLKKGGGVLLADDRKTPRREK